MRVRLVVALCAAALCLTLSGAYAASHIPTLDIPERSAAPGSIARVKCLVIGGAKFCDGKKGEPGGAAPKDTEKTDKGAKQAPTKCVVIGGAKVCNGKKSGGTEHKDKHKDKDKKDSKPPVQSAPKTACPLGTKSDGQCVCPAGQVNYSDGSCGKPCGYGMSGQPPNCKCVTGATLQMTGPMTKGCLCPDGNPPTAVDGNYACQNLGPQ